MEDSVNDAVRVIREVRAALTSWLDAARTLPDPASRPLATVRYLAAQVQRADGVLRSLTPAVSATTEWKHEAALYAETLRVLRARLGNFEMALRIRRNQMRGAQTTISVARSWSDLAKQIG
jgi:hypothetical protein